MHKCLFCIVFIGLFYTNVKQTRIKSEKARKHIHTRMRKRRKFTELRKKYCIRQVFHKKNHVQNLTVIGEEKKVGEK